MELNAKVADALRTMPYHKDTALTTIPGEAIHLPLFLARHGEFPDKGAQVYSFNAASLKSLCLRMPAEEKNVVARFEYTLCVSPMSPRRIHALAITSSSRTGMDPLTLMHAPEHAPNTDGSLVLHFTDQPSMHWFASEMGNHA